MTLRYAPLKLHPQLPLRRPSPKSPRQHPRVAVHQPAWRWSPYHVIRRSGAKVALSHLPKPRAKGGCSDPHGLPSYARIPSQALPFRSASSRIQPDERKKVSLWAKYARRFFQGQILLVIRLVGSFVFSVFKSWHFWFIGVESTGSSLGEKVAPTSKSPPTRNSGTSRKSSRFYLQLF